MKGNLQYPGGLVEQNYQVENLRYPCSWDVPPQGSSVKSKKPQLSNYQWSPGEHHATFLCDLHPLLALQEERDINARVSLSPPLIST